MKYTLHKLEELLLLDLYSQNILTLQTLHHVNASLVGIMGEHCVHISVGDENKEGIWMNISGTNIIKDAYH